MDSQQLDLFAPGRVVESDADWPDPAHMPYSYAGRSVDEILRADLRDAREVLLITGYASLEEMAVLLSQWWRAGASNRPKRIRILFGHEPNPAKRPLALRPVKLADELREYWHRRGLSLLQCGAVLDALALLRSRSSKVNTDAAPNTVEVRIATGPRDMHAKLYATDLASTVGSSNFTRSGMHRNLEGNVRFRAGTKAEQRRKAEVDQLAERLWEQGESFLADLTELLESLLRSVEWPDALAVACHELLHGEWAARFFEQAHRYDGPPLWPSQRQGIIQALWVLERCGSVLIADATGSGKTKLGTHLMRHLQQRIWSSGRRRKEGVVIFTPAQTVQQSWLREVRGCGFAADVHSHAKLSNRDPEAERGLRHGQILAIDEAHNFYNKHSNRTRFIHRNQADYTLLFTATPINRGLDDLLAVLQLLGPDNLEEETTVILEAVRRRKGPALEFLSAEEIEQLKTEIQRFTVRRTKRQFNAMIDREPERYRDHRDRLCRYPEHHSEAYATGECEHDAAIAREILALTRQLVGLNYFQKPLELPRGFERDGLTGEQYVNMRIQSARGLAAYMVLEALRSSSAALVENLAGTRVAEQAFDLAEPVKSGEGGNLIATLEGMAFPTGHAIAADLLPPWLQDSAAFEELRATQVACCRKILAQVGQMRCSREQAKAALLLDLQKNHGLLLAFDRHIITVHAIAKYLPAEQVLFATGASNKDQLVARVASGEPAIVLCTEALSEGVNLQTASALVHLDSPSVMRIGEQRTGRIDRMDSPHERIHVYWPKDGPAFALGSVQKLVQRHRLVLTLLGSNLPLPFEGAAVEGELQGEPVGPKRAGAGRQGGASGADLGGGASGLPELHDGFDPVKQLVEGARSIVPSTLWNALQRQGHARRNSTTLALVRSGSRSGSGSTGSMSGEWAFFCLRGSEARAPFWVLFEGSELRQETSLAIISKRLRDRLGSEVEVVPLGQSEASLLQRWVERLQRAQRLLLPPAKRRALEEMEQVLKIWREATHPKDQERREILDHLLDWLRGDHPDRQVDPGQLAEAWIELIHPVREQVIEASRRRRPIRMRDLRKTLVAQPLPTADLVAQFHEVPPLPPIDQHLAAAIIGVES